MLHASLCQRLDSARLTHERARSASVSAEGDEIPRSGIEEPSQASISRFLALNSCKANTSWDKLEFPGLWHRPVTLKTNCGSKCTSKNQVCLYTEWNKFDTEYKSKSVEFWPEPMQFLVDMLNHAHWLRICNIRKPFQDFSLVIKSWN